MHNVGEIRPTGDLGIQVYRQGVPVDPRPKLSAKSIIENGLPQYGLDREVNRWRLENQPHLFRGVKDAVWAFKAPIIAPIGTLYIRKIFEDGRVLDYGLAGCRVVTTAFVESVTDSMQNQTTTPIDVFDFHGIGTGSTAEAIGDTALVTELTTEYQTDNVRATGTPGEGASANIYQNVGTNTVDAAVALREHGLFTQAATGGGTLCDRTVYALINLANGDSLQTTYELTWTAGG